MRIGTTLSSTPTVAVLALAAVLASAAWTPLQAQVDAGILRTPDVSETHIAFVYAGDVWIVEKAGGTARRLSSPRGEEAFPRFSPDGAMLAFTANYDGNDDVYVVPALGGDPTRVTHHPAPDRLLDWYPEGGALLYASSMQSGRQRYSQLFRTSAGGGLPERLPVPYGEFGAISPDGRLLAYMPKSRDFRTWKRYRGGWAPEIWIFDLEDYSSRNVSDSPANDAHPMWHGDTLYFLSDRGPGQRHNIWAYDLQAGGLRQVTHFTDFDIHFPAIGPSDIVFEAGGQLHRLELPTEEVVEVDVHVVTDRSTLRPRVESVTGLISDAGISPTGKRAVFEARGEVFTVPAEHGVVRNLTRTSGAAERTPAWSPDGRWIAYWSDAPGEYQLMLRRADGSGDERRITSFTEDFRYRPHWSPDSDRLAYVDNAMRIWILDVDSGQATEVDRGLWMYHGALSNFTPSWSRDGRWLAWSRGLPNRGSAIFLYDTDSGERHQATSGFYADFTPVFDPDGDYLYYLSNRSLQPSYSDLQNTWIYPNATQIVAVPLRQDVPSPLAPRNDEEEPDGGDDGADNDEVGENGDEDGQEGSEDQDEDETDENGDDEDDGDAPGAVEIDLDGFEARAVVMPPEAGNYTNLSAASGKVVYRRVPRTGSGADAKAAVVYYDLEEREEKTVLGNADFLRLSHDGNKVLVARDRRFAILDLKPDRKLEEFLATDRLETTVDPRAEWRQMFADAWRLMRDYFYDPGLHGVDWQAMRDRYGALIEDAVTRWDVNFVIGELIAELNASHTYRGGGDVERPGRRGVGLLGVDWSLEGGAYRIERVLRGAPWDVEVRSPLDEPAVDVEEGDWVLAVNGVPLDTSRDPWAAFEGLADQTIELTVNDSPTIDGARQVLVETLTLGEEDRLRYLAWIDANRRRVDEATDGRVGYLYVPDTGIGGQTELVRQFVAQFDRSALIIDERFNSGGQIPDRFVELLDRPPLAFWAVRDGRDWQWPPVAHFGPKVMLINGWSGSGGDAFPEYFRTREVGPLIGTRTWGGLIGITGAPSLVDGGGVTVPTFRMYGPDGEWFPEGHGVEPDIEVVDDPTAMARGTDPQLERAIEEILRMLEESPYVQPPRPAFEDRTPASEQR